LILHETGYLVNIQVILAVGLLSNEPFIHILQDQKSPYILVYKEGNHTYLTD